MSTLPLSAFVRERDFQTAFMQAAKLHGWLRVHIRATEIRKGQWSVPYEGDSGIGDIILAKDGRLLMVELKREKGRVTPQQQAWLDAAGDNGRVFRPSQWAEILEELRR